jgi:hypothetical protein
MTAWATRHPKKASQESFPRLNAIQTNPAILTEQPLELRNALLDFIADFANWDNSTDKDYLETSRALVQASHEALGGLPGTRPLVVDPFAGGGRRQEGLTMAIVPEATTHTFEMMGSHMTGVARTSRGARHVLDLRWRQ